MTPFYEQPGHLCPMAEHLRGKYPDKLGLVEEYIVESAGARKDCDITRWGQFTDIKRHGLPVAMEREVALSSLQALVSFLGKPERPQVALQNLFWNCKWQRTNMIRCL